MKKISTRIVAEKIQLKKMKKQLAISIPIISLICVALLMLMIGCWIDSDIGNLFLVKDTVIEKRQFAENLLYFKNSIATKAQLRFMQELIVEHIEDVVHDVLLYDNEKELWFMGQKIIIDIR